MYKFETGKTGTQKISSLSFIKGAACFIVAANHFFNLYPVRCTGPLSHIERWFTNGSYMVYIFLVISFFFSGLKVYENENFCIGRETMKRYIRLILPVMLMYTVVFLMKQGGLFDSLEYALKLSGGGVKRLLTIQMLPLYPPCIKQQCSVPFSGRPTIISLHFGCFIWFYAGESFLRYFQKCLFPAIVAEKLLLRF